ncbi:unnamed protein product [Chrysoparadoxa australica]
MVLEIEERARSVGKISTVLQNLRFSSTFDSGNLARVEWGGEINRSGQHLFRLWTAKDCEGEACEKRNSSWFHFSITRVGQADGWLDKVVVLRIMNMNVQRGLYKNGMTPCMKSAKGRWFRMRAKVEYLECGNHLELQFPFKFPRGVDTVFFAFCYPHSYEDLLADLADREQAARKAGAAVNPILTPTAGPAIYFHRELLAYSLEGRRLEMLTISDCTNILEEREPHYGSEQIMFPHRSSGPLPFLRPHEFTNKPVVFVSARVHPGETPASFVMQGILEFLLRSDDPRAAELRRNYVFKLIPMLNPDGVARGHFRHDTRGQNLNRFYTDPSPQLQPTIYAAKAVLEEHCSRPEGRAKLKVYLDLHAHATKRGCFAYGNHHDLLETQVDSQLLPLLMTVQSAHFCYSACNFSKQHMYRVDSGDAGLSAEGTGRVWCGMKGGVAHSFTLECNYNSSREISNHVPEVQGCKSGLASPERKPAQPTRYSPNDWREVGRGFLVACLDMEGLNPWSRLPNSKYRSVARARRFISNELRSNEYKVIVRGNGQSALTPPSYALCCSLFALPLTLLLLCYLTRSKA